MGECFVSSVHSASTSDIVQLFTKTVKWVVQWLYRSEHVNPEHSDSTEDMGKLFVDWSRRSERLTRLYGSELVNPVHIAPALKRWGPSVCGLE